jgi:hypothetical protein
VTEDWRLSFEVVEGAAEVVDDLKVTAPAGVSVSRQGRMVFVYGDTRELVEQTPGDELARVGRLRRWHPGHGWIDPAEWVEPEPVEPADWEVDVVVSDAQAAKQLVRELERDTRHGHRDGRRVVITGLTRSDAERLAAELPLQVPPGSRAEARQTVEHTLGPSSSAFGFELGVGRGGGHGHHGGHHFHGWFFVL